MHTTILHSIEWSSRKKNKTQTRIWRLLFFRKLSSPKKSCSWAYTYFDRVMVNVRRSRVRNDLRRRRPIVQPFALVMVMTMVMTVMVPGATGIGGGGRGGGDRVQRHLGRRRRRSGMQPGRRVCRGRWCYRHRHRCRFARAPSPEVNNRFSVRRTVARVNYYNITIFIINVLKTAVVLLYRHPTSL